MPASEIREPADHPGVKVHESAYVDEGCTIGAGSKIWHFSHVMPGCTLGERCNIGQNVVISPGVTLGNNVKVQNNVSLYTGVVLENDVFCGPSMVFTNITNPRSEIVRRDQYAETRVKQGATIGANATIVCGTTIGRFAFIAAGAVVSKDVPDYAMMLGVPARRRGWACRCGGRMPDAAAGQTVECPDCGNTYRQGGTDTLDPVHEQQGAAAV